MPPQGGGVPQKHHAVHYYGTGDSLFTTVSGFLGGGLAAGHPAFVIATEDHRAGVLEHLSRRGIDEDRARRDGDLVVLDARQVLGACMAGDMPSAAAFDRALGGALAPLRERRPRTIVRAYGEMVDVLWRGGNSRAAIALEILWNKLAQTHAFGLLCGYSMGHFYKQVDRFEEARDPRARLAGADSRAIAPLRRTARPGASNSTAGGRVA